MRGSRSVKTTAKETVKKAAATAKKAAEPVVEVKEAVKPVVEETVKTVAEVAEKAVSKAEEVKSEVKKTAEKKTAEKRTRKTAVKESVYLQYLGKELNSADIVEAAKKASGEKTITSITVYLKPEENKAYYVVNGDVTGSVEL